MPAPLSREEWMFTFTNKFHNPDGTVNRALVDAVHSTWDAATEKAAATARESTAAAYRDGIIEGLQRFAWWKDGTQYVGTCGRTLKEAVAEAEDQWKRGNACIQ